MIKTLEGGKLNPVRAAWGFWSDDGQQESVCTAYICHQSVRYAPAGLYDQMVSSYPVPHDKFMDFLINQFYGKWAKHFHVEMEKTTGEQYLRISELGTLPANVLYNFLISSRLPFEFPTAVEHWDKMVERGINPGFALGVCRSGVMGYHYGCGETNWNHWPLNNTSDPVRLVNNTSCSHSKFFKDHPDAVTPCNVMWGHSRAFQGLKSLDDVSIDNFWLQWKEQNAEILLTP